MGGVVALNEVLHLDKVYKRECFQFKLDFEKVSNYISWYFLDYMLPILVLMIDRELGSECVFLGSLSVFVSMLWRRFVFKRVLSKEIYWTRYFSFWLLRALVLL